jgi:ATP-binding cassette, subfamily B, multidrug efflux pump
MNAPLDAPQTTDASRGEHTGARHRQALSLLRDAARPEARQVLLGALGLMAAAALEALGPMLGKAFIDTHLVPRQGPVATMAGLLLGAWVAGLLAAVLRYGQLRRLAGVAMRSVRRLREQVYTHVLALPMGYFDRAITGQLVSRVTNDTEAVKRLYVQVLFVMLDSGIVLGSLFAAMLWLDPRLAALVALLLPAVAGIVWAYQRWSAPAVARERTLRGELNAQTAESIAGMAVLQATGATRAFGERYARTNAAHYAARQDELRANAWLLRPALDFLNVALLAGVIAVFAHRAQLAVGALEVGLLYAFVSYIARVVEPLIQITMQFSQLQQAVVAAARVNTLLREPAAARTAGGERVVASGQVRFDAVRFGYGDGATVIDDVSLTVDAGRMVGIVGPTGSGKSTLMALLLGFHAPRQGSVQLDGRPLAAYDDAALRAAVGVVPQEPFLLAASVRDNIDMGRGLPDDTLRRAAAQAGAATFIERLPEGWDTVLGEGGARLATGEKQLLALARALAGGPRLLLLDEATSHIDSGTEAQVQAALAALRGQVTVIAIAHRLSTVRDADAIVVLSHGRIVEQGTHAELLAIDGGLYQRLHEMQALESTAD